MIPLALGCVWLIAANVAAMLPSRRQHWPVAWVLIALGVPLLAWILWANGPWIGLAMALAAASILRWPILLGARRVVAWVRPR